MRPVSRPDSGAGPAGLGGHTGFVTPPAAGDSVAPHGSASPDSDASAVEGPATSSRALSANSGQAAHLCTAQLDDIAAGDSSTFGHPDPAASQPRCRRIRDRYDQCDSAYDQSTTSRQSCPSLPEPPSRGLPVDSLAMLRRHCVTKGRTPRRSTIRDATSGQTAGLRTRA